MDFVSLRRDSEHSVPIDSVANRTQLPKYGAPHIQSISRAQVPQIENRLRGGCQALGSLRINPQTSKQHVKWKTGGNQALGVEHNLFLDSTSFFTRGSCLQRYFFFSRTAHIIRCAYACCANRY